MNPTLLIRQQQICLINPPATSPSCHLSSPSDCHLMSCACTLEGIHLKFYWDEFQHSCLDVEHTDTNTLISWPTCNSCRDTWFHQDQINSLFGQQNGCVSPTKCTPRLPTKSCNSIHIQHHTKSSGKKNSTFDECCNNFTLKCPCHE